MSTVEQSPQTQLLATLRSALSAAYGSRLRRIVLFDTLFGGPAYHYQKLAQHVATDNALVA